jgi:formylglycine-generating enzyme required for sulfatase activity
MRLTPVGRADVLRALHQKVSTDGVELWGVNESWRFVAREEVITPMLHNVMQSVKSTESSTFEVSTPATVKPVTKRRSRIVVNTVRAPLALPAEEKEFGLNATLPLTKESNQPLITEPLHGYQELVEWSRLGPRLESVVSRTPTNQLDVARIVKDLSKGYIPKRLPFKQRLSASSELTVVLDFSASMMPFYQDMHRLCHLLIAKYGHSRLSLRVIQEAPTAEGNFSGFDDWRLLQISDSESTSRNSWYQWDAPQHAAVLIVSDLGTYANTTTTLWQTYLQKLKNAGYQTSVLAPISRYRISARACAVARIQRWSPDASLYAERGVFAENCDEIDATKADVERLLAQAVIAPRIDPPTLRQLRKLSPRFSRDSGIEGEFWNHQVFPDQRRPSLRIIKDRQHYESKFSQLPALDQEAAYTVLREELSHRPALERHLAVVKSHALAKHLFKDSDPSLLDAKNFFDSLLVTLENLYVLSQFDLRSFESSSDQIWLHHATKYFLESSEAERNSEPLLMAKLRTLVVNLQEKIQTTKVADQRQANLWFLCFDGEQLTATLASVWPNQPLATYVRSKAFDVALPQGGWNMVIPQGDEGTVLTLANLNTVEDFPVVISDNERFEFDDMPIPSWAKEIGRNRLGAYVVPTCLGNVNTLKLYWQSTNDVAQWKHRHRTRGFSAKSEVVTYCPEGLPKSANLGSTMQMIGSDLQYGLYLDVKVGLVTQRFRWIEPGNFQMGRPNFETGHDDEMPQSWVRISRGYWMADSACTQAFWLEVMGGENPSHFSKHPLSPVERVTRKKVMIFTKKLTELLIGSNMEALLPSEAEWEYACRAGTKEAFSFGTTITSKQANYWRDYPNLDNIVGSYRDRTVPVKTLPANPWGLYEMHGNVWEWCRSAPWTYEANNLQFPVIDPEGRGYQWVQRGGSWNHDAYYARSSYRRFGHTDMLSKDTGFRVVLRLLIQSQAESESSTSLSARIKKIFDR